MHVDIRLSTRLSLSHFYTPLLEFQILINLRKYCINRIKLITLGMPDIDQVEFQEQPQESHEYSILSEGKRTWSKEWALSEYVSLTDGLIGKLDGSIPLKNVKALHDGKEEEGDLEPPDGVIYLDKSARPVAWMVRNLWPQLADKRDGETVKKPHTFFLNIDKQDWLRRMGVSKKYIEDPPIEMIDYSKIDPEHISRIRALFSTVPIEEADIDKAWEYPTYFDGKHIMVVDEVASSGATLNIAKNLLSRAFPTATISGQYWAKPNKVFLNGGVPDSEGRMQFQMDWVPPWYSATSDLGRGVGDRDPKWAEISESMGQKPSEITRIGRHVLSTPTRNPKTNEFLRDTKAERLESEIHNLAGDLRDKKVLYRPSQDRLDGSDTASYKSFIDRVERINGMPFAEWRVRRDLIAPKKT